MATKRSKTAKKAPAKKATKKRASRRPVSNGLGFSRKEQKEFQAQDDLRVLRQAEEIRANPARQREAQKMADKEMKALERVRGRG